MIERRRGCFLAFGVTFLGLVLAGHASAAPADYEPVRERARKLVGDGSLPSVVIGVVDRKAVVWAEAFGMANLERKTPATRDSIYRLASVSKPFTATGLMILVERDLIDLDAPANRYLTGAKLRSHVGPADALTVRRLANHTGGLPTHHDFFYDGVAPPPRDETIRRYGFAAWEPGSRWNYSNLAFGILDHITATVSGQPWSTFMQQTIYDPLGMSRTSDGIRPGREADAAVPYTRDISGRYIPVDHYDFDHPGASAVCSSFDDLTRFARMHLNDGELDGVRILSAESARAMRERTSRRVAGEERGNGVGWVVERVRGRPCISHGGGMPGVATQVRIFPEDGLATIVLANTENSGAVAGLNDRLSESLFSEASSKPNAPGGSTDPEKPEARTKRLTSWRGTWTGRLIHPDAGEIPVRLEVEALDLARVRFGKGTSLPVENLRVEDERATGEVAGRLGSFPNYHGPNRIGLQLDRKADKLTGVAAVGADWYFLLPHFVELTREAPPADAQPAAPTPGPAAGRKFDLVIRGGRIVDGTGAPWYRGDIGVSEGKIVAIGRLDGAQASRTLEADGLIVAPGFIDMMGQTAAPFLDDPRAGDNLLTQGITTINCGEGDSDAPLDEAEGRRRGWRTMAEFFARLDAAGMPINAVQTVGHTQVRRIVIGDVDRKATPEELERMRGLVAEGMDAGAIGLSTSLIYPPAVYAPTDEIVALARVVGSRGGRYYTHMRNEGDRLLEAIDEALLIGRESGAPVHIFHLKAAGRANWGKMPLAIARIRAARESGQVVGADVYPYINNGLGLRALIHPRHSAEGEAGLLKRLDDLVARAEIRREMEGPGDWENWYRHIGSDWSKVVLAGLTGPTYAPHNGKPLAEIARAVGKDPWDVFFEAARAGAFALPQTMSEANVIRAMQQEFISFDTDVGPAGGSLIARHPRAFGAFPRVLGRYVRDLGVLSLEAAIARMSAVAANEVMLPDRGRLAPGLAADIVVFDPDRIEDRATLGQPDQPSIGMRHVVVNGRLVLDDGKATDARPGRVLRGPGWRGRQP